MFNSIDNWKNTLTALGLDPSGGYEQLEDDWISKWYVYGWYVAVNNSDIEHIVKMETGHGNFNEEATRMGYTDALAELDKDD
jgi:hypothetical protein